MLDFIMPFIELFEPTYKFMMAMLSGVSSSGKELSLGERFGVYMILLILMYCWIAVASVVYTAAVLLVGGCKAYIYTEDVTVTCAGLIIKCFGYRLWAVPKKTDGNGFFTEQQALKLIKNSEFRSKLSSFSSIHRYCAMDYKELSGRYKHYPTVFNRKPSGALSHYHAGGESLNMADDITTATAGDMFTLTMTAICLSIFRACTIITVHPWKVFLLLLLPFKMYVDRKRRIQATFDVLANDEKGKE